MASINTPIGYRRLNPFPLDADTVVQSIGAIQSTWYEGMVIYEKDSSSLFVVYRNGTSLDTKAVGGGTGSSVSKKAFTIGDGTLKEFIVTHNLGTQDVIIQCRLLGDHNVIEDLVGKKVLNSNEIQINFGSSPPLNGVRVVVIG